MKTVGVRELKAHISEILRQVQEHGEIIEVTNHGQPVAQLVPARRRVQTTQDNSEVWTDLDTLAAEIGKYLPAHVDAVQAVNDVRREL